MPNVMEELIPGSCKIRKRGCSSSSSSSSRVHNNRLKRAILVGKVRVSLGGSRSSTPVPTWKTTPLRSAVDSPKYAGSQQSRPVSARKLAATLWEMNEMPTPKVTEILEEKRVLLRREKELKGREKMGPGLGSVHSGSLPPHLSDPSYSPISERMDRSGTGSRNRRAPSISQRIKLVDHKIGVVDSVSSASLMEIETRSRVQTPCWSVVGGKNRLKDVSNALTTSKELLKIINRVWAHDDQPSTSLSLVSALHAELERARLHVNQLIQEQHSDRNEINYLLKCFAEEKAAWKNKEQEAVEAAIESIASELEVERKLRRRFESLNKKLGKELADTKALFMKAVKELESEKRERELMEQMCDDLARDIGEDRSEMEDLKTESVKFHEAEREKERLHLADMLLGERVKMKLSEAKHQFEDKTAAVDELRSQLAGYHRAKRGKEKEYGSEVVGKDEEIAAYLSKSLFASRSKDEKEGDSGEVENGADCEVDSAESDLHSIKLNRDNTNKTYKWIHSSVGGHDTGMFLADDESKARNSKSGRGSRPGTSIQRSISDVVEWAAQKESIVNSGDGINQDNFHGIEKLTQRKSCGDEGKMHKSIKGLRESVLPNFRLGSSGDFASPIRQWSQPWQSRDHCNMVKERPSMLRGGSSKLRLGEAKGELSNLIRSKR